MIFNVLMFVDYTYYETLDTQQPSLQCQISCCLVPHPSEVPAYDWKDMSVSTAATFRPHLEEKNREKLFYLPRALMLQQQTWPPVMADVSLGPSVPNESPHFFSVPPPQKSSKGIKAISENLSYPAMEKSSWSMHGCIKNREES